jgi:hypothetical protein
MKVQIYTLLRDEKNIYSFKYYKLVPTEVKIQFGSIKLQRIKHDHDERINKTSIKFLFTQKLVC